MKDFIQELNESHKNSIKKIKELIDTDSELVKKYPDYTEPAVLCKFIYDYEFKYELLAHPKEYGRFYENAADFECLCDSIYHALVDDGDICFVRFAEWLCPRIAFRSRWDLKLEDIVPEDQMKIITSTNEIKRKHNLPEFNFKLEFYNDVYEYIEAVKHYNAKK